MVLPVVLWSIVMLAVNAAYDGMLSARIVADTIPQIDDTATPASRLSVRPRVMATGTQTQHAGRMALEGLSGYYVYVPPQCVGTTRSPLVVLLHGGGRNGLQELAKFQPLADKYGMIVLAPNAVEPGIWDVISAWVSRSVKYTLRDRLLQVSTFPEWDVRNIDTAITRVLRTHAIDPDRIALLGFSNGGSYSLFLGLSNLDVFSRIAPLSAMIPFSGIGPQNPTTQVFLSGGRSEQGMAQRTLSIARTLRRRGHPVVTQIGLRGHIDLVEDENFVWAWLQQSWVDPTVTTRIPAKAASDVVLTTEVLRKMIDFWDRFRRLPGAIRDRLRMNHQMEVPLTLGTEQTTVILMNLPAMAVASPEIAALLESVGLTAQTAMAYRNAIIQADLARLVGIRVGRTPRDSTDLFEPIAPTSVLGKNLEFWEKNAEMFELLTPTGMWRTQ